MSVLVCANAYNHSQKKKKNNMIHANTRRQSDEQRVVDFKYDQQYVYHKIINRPQDW